MKRFFALIIISITVAQQTKQILIKCDVLGNQNGGARYYPPD